ncbi:MAG: WD40 repeat domain-containing protein [Chloroflexota bacterium]|nr:WD40 repeat domain-containing protein [Chloroflexota bacterium]
MLKIVLLLALVLSLSRDGARAGEACPTITPYNVHTLVEVETIGRGSVRSYVLSPDETRLVVVTALGAWVYDMSDTSAPPIHLVSDTGETYVFAVMFTPNGQNLIVSFGVLRGLNQPAQQQKIHIYDHDLALVRSFTLNYPSSLQADDHTLLQINNGSITLWRLATGRAHAEISTRERASVQLTADRRLVLLDSPRYDVRYRTRYRTYDTRTGDEIGTEIIMPFDSGPNNPLALNRDGSMIAVYNEIGDSNVQLIRLSDQYAPPAIAFPDRRFPLFPRALTFSEDGRWLFVLTHRPFESTEDHRLDIIEIAQNRIVHSLPLAHIPTSNRLGELLAAELALWLPTPEPLDMVTALIGVGQFNPPTLNRADSITHFIDDNTLLMRGSNYEFEYLVVTLDEGIFTPYVQPDDKAVFLYDSGRLDEATYAALIQRVAGDQAISELLVDRRNRQIFLAYRDGTISVWSLDDLSLVTSFSLNPFTYAQLLAISPDGATLYVVSNVGRLTAWSIPAARALLLRADPTLRDMQTMHISPDGSLLIMPDPFEYGVRFIDTCGAVRHTLFDPAISDAIISPDGRRVITLQFTSCLRVWCASG